MKQRLLDALVWMGIAACCGFPSCALAYPALSQEPGRGIICDEAADVEKFLTPASSTQSAEAISQVNDATNACAIVTVAFVRGAEVITHIGKSRK